MQTWSGDFLILACLLIVFLLAQAGTRLIIGRQEKGDIHLVVVMSILLGLATVIFVIVEPIRS